jgi:hypothetical protein
VNASQATMKYEHTVYDGEVENRVDELMDRVSTDGAGDTESTDGYPVSAARALADDGAVANADSRWRGAEKFRPSTESEGEDLNTESNYSLDASNTQTWSPDTGGESQ